MKVDGEQRQQKVVVGLREQHGTKKQAKVSDAGAETHLSYSNGARRAAKAMDSDLYVIPPDMLCHNNHLSILIHDYHVLILLVKSACLLFDYGLILLTSIYSFLRLQKRLTDTSVL